MRRVFLVSLASITALATASPVAAESTARDWLERMTRSLASLHYDGLFIHTAGSQSESMRIVHRTVDGRSVERLVSLDGSGREIVRTPEEVHFYLPDRRVVLVEPRSDDGSLLKALPAPGPQLDALYTLATSPGSRLLRRDVQILDIRPRDAYRYGYRMWLDVDTAMPLRTMVLDHAGRPVEVINFTQIDMPRHIDAKATEASMDASGFKWVRDARRPQMAPPATVAWRPKRLPPGFRLVTSRMQVVPGVAFPVQHLIFSDGFASISVFIEPPRPAGPTPPESSSVGSANAFSTVVHGRVVTAVGEVPLETVRDVARSVVPDMPPSGAAFDDAGIAPPEVTTPGATALQPH